MVMGNFQFRGLLLIQIIARQGQTAIAAGAVGICLTVFSSLSSLSLPLWETARIKTEILSQRAVKPTTTSQPEMGIHLS